MFCRQDGEIGSSKLKLTWPFDSEIEHRGNCTFIHTCYITKYPNEFSLITISIKKKNTKIEKRTHAHTHARTHTHTYIHTYIHTHIHTHIRTYEFRIELSTTIYLRVWLILFPVFVDFDECKERDGQFSDCYMNAWCLNTRVSYMCSCKHGFEDWSPDPYSRPGRACNGEWCLTTVQKRLHLKNV